MHKFEQNIQHSFWGIMKRLNLIASVINMWIMNQYD